MRTSTIIALIGASVVSAQSTSYATSVAGASLYGPIPAASSGSYVPYQYPSDSATVAPVATSAASSAASSSAAPNSYATSVSGASLYGPIPAVSTGSYVPYSYPGSAVVAPMSTSAASSGMSAAASAASSAGVAASGSMASSATMASNATYVATAKPAAYTGAASKVGAGVFGLVGAVAAAVLA